MSLIFAGIAAPIIIYFYKKTNVKIQNYIVEYSEVVGNIIVAHDKPYKGLVNIQKDLFTVKQIGLKLPVPPKDAVVSTVRGGKKVYPVGLQDGRVGYRVPSMHNRIIIEERDENGSVVKLPNGRAKLKRYKWKFSDDVIEPNVAHWQNHMNKELEERHRINEGLLSKYITPAAIALMFITAVILGNQTVKTLERSTDSMIADKQAIMEQTINIQKETVKTQESLNNLLNRVSGTRILEQEGKNLNNSNTG